MLFEEFGEDDGFKRIGFIFDLDERHLLTALGEDRAHVSDQDRQDKQHARLRLFFYFLDREMSFFSNRFVRIERMTRDVDAKQLLFPHKLINERNGRTLGESKRRRCSEGTKE